MSIVLSLGDPLELEAFAAIGAVNLTRINFNYISSWQAEYDLVEIGSFPRKSVLQSSEKSIPSNWQNFHKPSGKPGNIWHWMEELGYQEISQGQGPDCR